MNNYLAIAIDGPAASGKSTVAKRLAEELGLIMVNSGAMYRAVTWAVLENGVAPDDAEGVVALLGNVCFQAAERDGQSIILVDGKVLTHELRSSKVNMAVSKIAAIPEVRELLVAKQRDFLSISHLVMEGRDIGTVVFPDTPYKFFISASEEVRAARRVADGEGDSVTARDKQDSERKVSPLRIADGANEIDSSDLTVEQVIEVVKDDLREKGFPLN